MTTLEEPIAFPSLDLNRTTQPQAEPSELVWKGDTLKWIGIGNLNCSAFKVLAPEAYRSLRAHVISFAQSGKYASQTWFMAIAAIHRSLAAHPTREFDLGWIVNAITRPGFHSRKSTIVSFFMYWHDRYPHAITSDALQFLVRSLPKRKRTSKVLSDDPEESWLTDLEYDALIRCTWDNYDRGHTGTQITLMRLLSLQYARRPIQIAQLKIGDFRDDPATGASSSERRIHFPGAKDQGAKQNFRDSKEEVHPVADHLWDLFQIQKQDVKALFEQQLGSPLTEPELKQLPAFTSGKQIDQAINTLSEHYRANWRARLDHRLFHLEDVKVSRVLKWATNTLGDYSKQGKPTPPLSHRTGRPIRVNATRMRHTRARQLARLGTTKHVLSFWLGHTSEKSLAAYYNDPAEVARQINDAMKGALAPIAMAFTGRLLDDESQATRANDPESTLEFAAQRDLKNVGKCGKHSFCSTTSVPIPCYRCKMFEPLVYAPHEEVLYALVKRQTEEDAMIKIGGARKLLAPIDLGPDIRAVQACIARCNARKAELEANHD
ncbi:site-specific integrase [Herbaspirillum robiniae]|nr:site-specific integrase [Herbaspirillum robiniae]